MLTLTAVTLVSQEAGEEARANLEVLRLAKWSKTLGSRAACQRDSARSDGDSANCLLWAKYSFCSEAL